MPTLHKDDPWIGREFASGGILGLRLLIVGESTYHDAADSDPANMPYAKKLIEYVLAGWRKTFYTRVYQVCTGRKHWESSSDDRERFWHSVAFVNYIPAPVGSRPRQRPTDKHWQDAAEPFREVLASVVPEAVLFLGKSLWWHVCHAGVVTSVVGNSGSVPCRSPIIAVASWVKHPSAGFNSEQWRPRVEELLQRAAIRKE